MTDPTPSTGVAPVNLSSDVGKVRLLVGDTDPINVASGQGEYFWYSDDELTTLLSIQGTPQRTAIYVLRMVSLTPALQLKKWQSADLAVDGPAISTALAAIIRDIENGITATTEAEAADLFSVVNTGAPIAQPALYPQNIPEINGVPLDPTIPLGIPARQRPWVGGLL
jgi:hypothetical protein